MIYDYSSEFPEEPWKDPMGSWFRAPDSPDFTFILGWDDNREGQLADRVFDAANESVEGEPSWHGRTTDPAERIFIEFDVTNARGRSGKTSLTVEAPSLDVPVTVQSVLVRAPIGWVREQPSVVARGLLIVACLEVATAAYCRWRGWPEPGPIPRTSEELDWIAQHGEPVVPGWVGELKVRPQRKAGTKSIEALLAAVAGRPVPEMVAQLIEQAGRRSDRQLGSVIDGWHRLLREIATSEHWEAAEEVLGWELSNDVFHDLRNYVALVAPEVAKSGDVQQFAGVLSQLTDEEDVGKAGSVTDLLEELAEERDVDTSHLPDAFAVHEQPAG